MRKVTSTLNYLLNDGDLTNSIEKEVNESERFMNSAATEAAGEDLLSALHFHFSICMVGCIVHT